MRLAQHLALALCVSSSSLAPSSAAAQCLVAELPALGTQIQLTPIALSATPTGAKVAVVDNLGGHVFDVSTGQEVLLVPFTVPNARFSDVGIDDRHVVFGDPLGDPNFAGSAHVYDHATGTLVNHLFGGGFCDFFGSVLDVDDGAALVWEPEAIVPEFARVYFFADAATATSADLVIGNPTGVGTYGFELALGTRGPSSVGVVIGRDGGTYRAYVYDLTAQTQLALIECQDQIRASAIDGGLVALGTGHDVRVHDVDSGDLVALLPLILPSAQVSLSFSDGLLAVGARSGGNGDVALYDTSTWAVVRRIPAPANATEFAHDVHLDGDLLATVARIDFQLRVQVYSVPRPTNDANGNGWDDGCEWLGGPTSGHWYRATPVLDWQDAEQQAVAWTGHLATVRNLVENAWIASRFAQSGAPWIGYTDEALEGTFVWSSGETPGFEVWGTGQPDNVGGADWTVVGVGSGRWRDEPASPRRAGVAEVVSDDCDGDGVPDLYDIAVDPARDFDGDAVLDDCVSPNYCIATTNSTGGPARIEAFGSPRVAVNQLYLRAIAMPAGEFGYFLASASPGFVPLFGGSSGNLCLGLPIVRFNKPPEGAVLSSGAAGSFTFRPDLTLLPPGVVFAPGETWHFQAWFRDGQTSNTTDGIAVLFR